MSELAINLEGEDQPSGPRTVDLSLGLTERALGREIPSLSQVPRAIPTSYRGLAALLEADTLAIGLALLIGPALAEMVIGNTPAPRLLDLIYVPIFLAVMTCYGLYRRGRRRLVGSSFPDISHMAHSIVVAGALSLVAGAGLHRAAGVTSPDAWQMTVAGLLGLIFITQARATARFLGRRRESSGSRILIVGSGVVAGHVVGRLASVKGVTIVGWVDDDLLPAPRSDMGGIPRLGGLDDLVGVVGAWKVDHVVVAFSPAGGSTLAGLLRELSAAARISVVPRLFDLLSVRSHVDDLRGLPVVDVAPPALGPAARFAKRALDVVVAGAGLLFLVPLMAVITVAVKSTSPGPVLFSQERTGRHRRAFRIHKFRTMRVNAEDEKGGVWNDADGPLFKAHEDPRVTSVGRFLRRASLDEIPQLFNVLKGEMSLVGPRPFVPGESREINGWASRRFDVRPGMTGLWQVSGRNDLPFDELCRLDYSYVASWSFWWDLHILWQTPTSVLRSDGAY